MKKEFLDSSAIDFDRFVRYNKSAPRYTSYPTAVEFKPDFDYEALKAAFIRNDKRSKEKGIPLSLYVHLPFCRSACYFCGCNVIYTSREDKKERYITLTKGTCYSCNAHGYKARGCATTLWWWHTYIF